MAINISQRITDYWPATETLLTADAAIHYATAKAEAIASARRATYGQAAVPQESDIPDLVGEFIADQATWRLIPLARDWYMLNRPESKDTGRGERINYHSPMDALDDLKAYLEQLCAERAPVVEDIIGKSLKRRPTPKVSTAGLIVDPYERALARGVPR